jgi:hypothetical protein
MKKYAIIQKNKWDPTQSSRNIFGSAKQNALHQNPTPRGKMHVNLRSGISRMDGVQV